MSSPFFADATLDLAEAHDIADTPEATRPQFDTTSIQANRLQLQIPTLQQHQHLLPQHALSDIAEETASQASAQDQHASTASIVRRSQSLPVEPSESLSPTSYTIATTSAAAAGAADASQVNDDNDNVHFTRISASLEQDCIPPVTSIRKPRWPRDISWTVAFLALVPVVLLYPFWHKTVAPAVLAQHPASFATLHAITWTVLAVVGLTRVLYRSIAGGDGEAVRLQAAQSMVTFAPCSVAVYAALTLTVLISCPDAWLAALVPAAYAVRDVYAFRRWTRRTEYAGGGYASRIAFFQAMVGMALDILSRSLRRASFVRGLSSILLVQLVVLLLWRAAFLAALSTSSTSSVPYTWMMVLLAWGAGKWATSTTTRFLTLLASAGVMNWCSEQGLLLSELTPPTSSNGGTASSSPRYRDVGNGHDGTNGADGEQYGAGDNDEIPEAYRTVDASVYQSVLELDDALDDDYDDLEDEVLVDAATSGPDRRRQSPSRGGMNTSRPARGNAATGHSPGGGFAASRGGQTHHLPRATVKSILWTGVTISFGSIAHCGLLGGLAQFIWSQIRRVEAAQTALHSQSNGSSGGGGFQGMSIGSQTAGRIETVGSKLIMAARLFARHHSDLAITHVAAYFKGYSRAARDVATIVDQSGLEPILHEDITTHMCTCIGGSISGVIVLITTYLLLHQRKFHQDVLDVHVVVDMLISFVLSYTLIFTVLEPLRAAIKASFISFAQDPRCLSQAYPLIYHRLNRLSDSNLS